MNKICNLAVTLFFVFLCSPTIAQTTLYTEDFETGGGSISINTTDQSSTAAGFNAWHIGNDYTGGSDTLSDCLAGQNAYTVPNTSTQPGGITNSPFSTYLMIRSDTAVTAGILCSSYHPADGLCFFNENYFSGMTNDISTAGYNNVSLTFWWACGGALDLFGNPAIYGELYYSTNSGSSWIQSTSPTAQYISQSGWAKQTVALAAFSGKPSLRFGFRFVNQQGAIIATDPGFIIDDIEVTGVSTLGLTTGAVNVGPHCPGDAINVPYTVTGSFNGSNVFTAELSGPTGSFASPTIIGSIGGTASGTISGNIFGVAGTGYRVRVVSSNPAGSGTVNPSNITIVTQPIAGGLSASKDTVCQGDSTAISIFGHAGNIDWQSSTDGVSYSSLGISSAFFNFTPVTQTTYFRAVLSNSPCNDDTAGLLVVTMLPNPVAGNISVQDDTLCSGESTTIVLSGSTGNIQWQNSTDGISYSNIAGQTATTLNTGALSSTTYFRVQVGSGLCSVVFTNDDLVEVLPSPAADFSWNAANLDVTFTSTSTGAISWAWDFGDTGTDATENPNHTYAANGSYNVTLIATAANGCSDTFMDSVTVLLVSRPGDLMSISNLSLHPNPFVSDFTLNLDSKVDGMLRLSLSDLTGREIKVIFDEKISIGRTSVRANSLENLQKGIYFLNIQLEDQRTTLKIIHTE